MPNRLHVAGMEIMSRRCSARYNVNANDRVAALDADDVSRTARVAEHSLKSNLDLSRGDVDHLALREHNSHVDRARCGGRVSGTRRQTDSDQNQRKPHVFSITN
jgi:hypothetical protein